MMHLQMLGLMKTKMNVRMLKWRKPITFPVPATSVGMS